MKKTSKKKQADCERKIGEYRCSYNSFSITKVLREIQKMKIMKTGGKTP